MSTIKIGIIGYGKWVKNAYIPAITNDGRATIVAISAKSDATIAAIQSQFGDTIAIYTNYKELLNDPSIDAVLIAVPDALHGQIVLDALDSDKAIFYEPPIGHTRDLIPKVLHKLKNASQITHADLELGLIPVVSKAAEFIKHKTIGDVQTVTIDLRSNWATEPDQDINTINRLSLWYVHVLNILVDATPNRVCIMDGYGVSGRRQNRSTGLFDYNGIWGELKVHIDSIDKLTITVEIIGSEGDILIDILTGKLTLRTKEKNMTAYFPALQPYADWPGMRESVTHFLDAVESGKPSFANPNLVAELQAIGMATEKSKDTGNWVVVDHHIYN
ncbi:Gfo/Idh/MocA family protein [Aquimarina longa]|uniref:Gfo/Idh/MocA family protein n=1 Tax=Aquimarina longa TaxID=1080221 RepID=UPI00078292ED|nr:Gfo/Idh/MocA family oxidoreductase [Aquimarina longa]